MTNSTQLHFLQQKIAELRSALFFSQNNDVITLPTSIITALRVDDEGHIWFFMNQPKQVLNSFEKQFPARLSFFRKDKDYSLEVSGKASIVNDEMEINALADLPEGSASSIMHQLILIKIKILNAEYFERRPEKKGYTLGYFTKRIWNSIFINPDVHRHYNAGSDHLRTA